MKKFLPALTVLIGLGLSTWTMADSGIDEVVYCQLFNGQRTVFVVNSDGGNQRIVVSGKDVKTFLIRKHILYFTNHQLFEYLPATGQSKLLGRFDEDKLTIQDLSDKSYAAAEIAAGNQAQAPDQAVILAETIFEQNLYIIEFSDGSIRTVTSSMLPNTMTSVGISSPKSYSPNQTALALVRQDGMKLRFEITIQEKKNGQFKTTWTLPKNMTIIPELPVWSPGSRWLAFYARAYESVSGFYSLYLYDRESKEMRKVQEQVFSTIPSNVLTMGSFVPEWSKDGRFLIFQYQNYGPTDSLIVKYEAETGIKLTLTSSRGHNLYPSWSPTGKSILFISNREAAQDQVYTIDANGEHLKRLSPPEGYTEWANWYKAE
jgi:Tol biopolymer transport system component